MNPIRRFIEYVKLKLEPKPLPQPGTQEACERGDHDWPTWCEPYQTTFSNGFGMSCPKMVQTRSCRVCRKMKWRKV